MPRITVTITDDQAELLEELVNVGRGRSCQLLLSLQSISQLRDTYNSDKASAILSGIITVIGLRTADEASVDFLRETISTEFEGYTRQTGDRRRPSETEQKEEYTFAKGDLRRFDPGEAVICRQGKGWVHAQIKELDG